MNLNDAEILQRIQNYLIDSYDEEFELELEDYTLEQSADLAFLKDGSTSSVSTNQSANNKEYRRIYFRELFH